MQSGERIKQNVELINIVPSPLGVDQSGNLAPDLFEVTCDDGDAFPIHGQRG